MDLNVFKILERTKVEGPGERFCIWVQGCSNYCKGCWAKDSWSHAPNILVSVDELYRKIIAVKGIEGVTFLGGEPFEQAGKLSKLARKINEYGLSVLTFTGNRLEDLAAKDDEDTNNLLKYTDLLIDGPFEEENFDLTRPWVGSSNKRYLFLSDRYSFDDIKDVKNKIEVRIDKKGYIFVNGMGDFEKVKKDLCLLTPKNNLQSN